MEQFRDTYMTECQELLSDMESHLMALESGSRDNELLHAIFRCIHSIKGGAGAFGLQEIAHFTHHFEYFLDILRSGGCTLNAQTMDLLFRGRDIVAQMVDAAQARACVPAGLGADLLVALQPFTQTTTTVVQANTVQANTQHVQEVQTQPAQEMHHYHIRFIPQPTFMVRGNEPYFLIKELAGLGALQVECNTSAIPDITHYDPTQCYLQWVMQLQSTCSEADIAEIFEFAEDCCTLEITRADPQAEQENTQKSNSTPPALAEEKSTSEPVQATTTAVATIRVETDKIDRLVNLSGELVITQGMLRSRLQRELPANILDDCLQLLEQQMRDMQEAVMNVRMQPVKSVFARMPRIVRDLSRKLDKKARLELHGEQTEVDKAIVEQLADPLVHMIRNSLDHGLETPQDRIAAGKPEEGVIRLSAYSHGGRIEIVIEDDGAGIRRDKVLARARERGMIAADVTPEPHVIDQLIFAAGFSTAEVVSDVSGRGVGMDVVRRNIEQIGGRVLVENNPGHGSRFIISLPLTLAILDGMSVQVGAATYIIPISQIAETLQVAAEKISLLPGEQPMLPLRGEYLPLHSLADIFLRKRTRIEGDCLVVVAQGVRCRYGLIVDRLIGQEQVVIKSLDEHTGSVDGISGATILGDGAVSLIVDVEQLYRMANQLRGAKDAHALPQSSTCEAA